MDNDNLLLIIIAIQFVYIIVQSVVNGRSVPAASVERLIDRLAPIAERTENTIDDAVLQAAPVIISVLQGLGLIDDGTTPAPPTSPPSPVEPSPISVVETPAVDPLWAIDIPFTHRESGKIGNRHVDFPHTFVHIYNLHDVSGKIYKDHPEVYIKEEYNGAQYAIAHKGGKWGYYVTTDMQPNINYRISLDFSAVATFDGDNNLYWLLTINDEEFERSVELGDNRQVEWSLAFPTVVQTVSIQLFAKYGNAQDNSYVTYHRFSVIPHAAAMGGAGLS